MSLITGVWVFCDSVMSVLPCMCNVCAASYITMTVFTNHFSALYLLTAQLSMCLRTAWCKQIKYV